MALGLSKSLFKVQLTAIIIGIVLMIIALQYDVLVFIISIALYSFVNWLLVAIKTGKNINYGIFNQIKDISASLLIAIVTTTVSIYIMNLMAIESVIISLIVNVSVYTSIYVLLHLVLNTQAIKIIKSQIKR